MPVTAWAHRRPSSHVDDVAAEHRCRARRFVYRPKTRHRPGQDRPGWFIAIPVRIAGIIKRCIAGNTDDRLLPQHTLLIQWKRKRGGDVFRSWITDLPAGTRLTLLVRHATSRWSIETDYREKEQALGLGDHEGRTYGGFHCHVTLVSTAHLFRLEHCRPAGHRPCLISTVDHGPRPSSVRRD
ncbi:hypothetical protein AB0D74_15805 [Streptomyces sp. NPDC048278]|uniref:hypothetical protein n=1 Tax=unclassified Streptomyces TaxID=2593676 RepID=UPI00342352BE